MRPGARVEASNVCVHVCVCVCVCVRERERERARRAEKLRMDISTTSMKDILTQAAPSYTRHTASASSGFMGGSDSTMAQHKSCPLLTVRLICFTAGYQANITIPTRRMMVVKSYVCYNRITASTRSVKVALRAGYITIVRLASKTH